MLYIEFTEIFSKVHAIYEALFTIIHPQSHQVHRHLFRIRHLRNRNPIRRLPSRHHSKLLQTLLRPPPALYEGSSRQPGGKTGLGKSENMVVIPAPSTQSIDHSVAVPVRL